MSQYLVAAPNSSGGKIDIMPPLTEIKDALSFAGKANQELNQLRRNIIKPYLPLQFPKLADISDDSKSFLLEDSIADTVESLQKGNQTKSLLRHKTKLKREQPQSQQEPSNYQTSLKSYKRNSDNGQKQRRSVKSYSIQQTTQQTKNRQHQRSCHESTHQHTNTPVYYRRKASTTKRN